MTEQHSDRARPFEDILKGAVSRVPRPRLRSGARPRARASDLNSDDLNGVQTQAPTLVGGAFGHYQGSLLQVVVHNHGTRRQAAAGGLEGNGRRERQGVRTTTTGHQHQPTLLDLLDLCESATHGDADGRDGAMRSGHGSQPFSRARAGPKPAGSRSPRAAAGSPARSTRH